MALHTLKVFWQHRIARRAIASVVLLGAVAGESYLANVPLPVDIEAKGKFSPATVKLNQEELIIEAPVVNSQEGELFSDDGKANEVADVHFEHARLDEQTIEDLSEPNFNPPATPEQIDYTSLGLRQTPAAVAPCRTHLDIALNDHQQLRALHFFQVGAAGADRYRQLDMQADGAELAVTIATDATATDTPAAEMTESQSCGRTLQVGSLPLRRLQTDDEVRAIAAEGSRFHFIFRPLDTNVPLWEGGREGIYEPFVLGAVQVNPNDPPPFQARAVIIRKFQNDGSNAVPRLSARSADGGPLLIVSGLKIGSDELQIKVAGSGTLSDNGHVETVNFLERLGKNPILALLLGGLNIALLKWVISRFRTQHKTIPQQEAQNAD